MTVATATRLRCFMIISSMHIDMHYLPYYGEMPTLLNVAPH